MSRPTTKKNITYKTDKITKYFSENRMSFESFYNSEKEMMKTIDWFPGITVLDVGCGCGGLGRSLNQEFGVTNYTGVDIHAGSIEMARLLNLDLGFSFVNSDLLEVEMNALFDVVVSFSCVDWNIETESMISKCWKMLKPKGTFLATFRLTKKNTGFDKKSYQYINYEGQKRGEIAPYVTASYNDLFNIGKKLECSNISLNGYFREPSPVAVTKYSELFFCCVAFTKG